MRTRLFTLISKNKLVLSWILLICLPLINQVIPVFKSDRLNGSFETKKKQISCSWWDASFQKNIEDQLNDSLTIHTFCYRLRNQLEFSIANKINAGDMYYYNGVIYRMNSPLYNVSSNFAGNEKINADIAKLRAYREKARSKPMLFLIPTFKPQFYPNQLPAFNQNNTDQSNYKAYKKTLLQQGFPVFDANIWLREIQKKKPKPAMIGTAGVHWTLYAATLAMDSVVKFYEKQLKTSFCHPNYKLDYSAVYDEDEDGYRLANLLSKHRDPNLVQVHFPSIPVGKKLKALIVSDSYFHAVYWTQLYDQVFDSQSMFYYYMKTRKKRGEQDRPFTTELFKQDLASVDMILVISEVNNLEHFGFGFQNQLLVP